MVLLKMSKEKLGEIFFESRNQFSSVMSNSLQPHGLQHARLLCPSPTPGVCSVTVSITQSYLAGVAGNVP